MSEAEPCVILFSDGLLSKWGFGDGDAPDHFLDYCDEHDIPYPPWRPLLKRIVREYLLPALDQAVEVVTIGTNHNPVRAATVDGRDVQGEWYDDGADRTRLTPESVSVPFSAIFAMTGEETGGAVQPGSPGGK